MSFDDQIVKQKRIIDHLKSNLNTMTQNDLRDYSQEFTRSEKILKHHLRGYNNPAGRYLASLTFALSGVAVVLLRKPVGISLFRTIRPQDFAIVGLSAIVGYVYAGRFHGNNSEYKRLLAIYDEHSKPLNEEFNRIFEKL
jgi:hypothetical protein